MYLIATQSTYNSLTYIQQSGIEISAKIPLEKNTGDMTVSLLNKLKAHHADSFGWAMACCNWNQSLAEDVLQEAYLRVLDGRARFSGHATEKTWFFSVIKHLASDLYRTQKRHSILNLKLFNTGQDAVNESSDDDSLYQQTHELEESAQLKAALKALPQRQREVMHLVFYADMTLDEAAQTLGINLGSIRTHYHRGKTRLAQLLQLEPGAEDAGVENAGVTNER